MSAANQAKFLLAQIIRSVPHSLSFGKRGSHNLWFPDAKFMREFKVTLF